MSHGLDGSRRPDPFTEPAADGPTELVPNEKGDLVERLSAGTATILLVWLIGIGAGTALLGVWLLVYLLSGARLGIAALFGGPGLYTALTGAVVGAGAGGASGPAASFSICPISASASSLRPLDSSQRGDSGRFLRTRPRRPHRGGDRPGPDAGGHPHLGRRDLAGGSLHLPRSAAHGMSGQIS